MGISIRAYARQRGVSDTSVHKAIKAGRIALESDGSIDVERADAHWSDRTDPSQQRAKPTKAFNAKSGAPEVTHVPQKAAAPNLSQRSGPTEAEPSLAMSGSATFVQARTANEVIKAQTNKVKLSRMKGELIERKLADDTAFILAARCVTKLASTRVCRNGG